MVMRGDEYLSALCEQGISCCQAGKQLVGRLMTLWKLVFGDGPEYTESFFGTLYRPEDTLIWVEDCEIVSMLFLLPVFLHTQAGDSVPGRYVYAVATHPDWRRRGYSRALLLAADREIRMREEQFAVLHPASEPLYGFYGRLGYETAFSCVELTAPKKTERYMWDLSLLSYENFARRYMAFSVRRIDELLWADSALPFVYREAVLQQGGAFEVSDAEGGAIACGLYYQPAENLVLIKDLACDEANLEQVLAVCQGFWLKKEIRVRISVKKAGKWKKVSVSQPFGMIKYNQHFFENGMLQIQCGFMGAVLD